MVWLGCITKNVKRGCIASIQYNYDMKRIESSGNSGNLIHTFVRPSPFGVVRWEPSTHLLRCILRSNECFVIHFFVVVALAWTQSSVALVLVSIRIVILLMHLAKPATREKERKNPTCTQNKWKIIINWLGLSGEDLYSMGSLDIEMCSNNMPFGGDVNENEQSDKTKPWTRIRPEWYQ